MDGGNYTVYLQVDDWTGGGGGGMQAEPPVGVLAGHRYRDCGADTYCTPTWLGRGSMYRCVQTFTAVEESRVCLHAQSSPSLRVRNPWNVAPVLLSLHGRGHL